MLPEGEETPEKIRYQAASPDEAALVAAAKNFGFFFYKCVDTYNFSFPYQKDKVEFMLHYAAGSDIISL